MDSTNQVFLLLATHWIAVKQIMASITQAERRVGGEHEGQHACGGSSGGDGDVDVGIVRWLKHLNRLIEPEYMAYNQWPLWVEAELDRNPVAFGKRC